MSHRLFAVLALFTVTLVGCATETLDCHSRVAACTGPFTTCQPLPEDCDKVQPGASHALVEIDSSPTPAAIYLNGEYIGETPLRYPLSYTSLTRSLTVVAEPLYPVQTRQEQQLRIPPLPRRIQFYMNNPPGRSAAQEGPP